jgi:soluble lytic murein transglycosylase
MRHCLGRSILGRSFSSSVLCLFLQRFPRLSCASLPLLLLVFRPSLAPAESLEALAKAHLSKRSAVTEQALRSFASANRSNRNGALARLVLGRVALEQGRHQDAAAHFQAALPALPQLADYTNFYLAEALNALKKTNEAVAALETVQRTVPASPLLSWSVLRAARIWLDSGDPARAEAMLRPYLASLPQAPARLLLGRILMARQQWMSAAEELQKVYLEHPLSSEAAEAESLLQELEQRLGESYPPMMPRAMIERARRMVQGGAALRAVTELRGRLAQFSGADRDAAMVAIGMALYTARRDTDALLHLQNLTLSAGELDAERLYYIVAASRRLGRDEERTRALAALGEKYRSSPWRLEALVSEGNRALLLNSASEYLPAYTACFQDFESSATAAYCHWKVTWNAYMQRSPEAASLLREHVVKFPESVQAPTALYFLGRQYEQSGDFAAAASFYEAILNHYPGYFYAVLARERLSGKDFALNGAIRSDPSLLQNIRLPPREPPEDFSVNPQTRYRIERSRLLRSAALYDWSEQELRFGARQGANPLAIALEFGKDAVRRGETARALRFVKSMASGYLRWTLDDAPTEFWHLAFPFPYRKELETYCRQHRLDPFLMAGLIRQESEFDPRAVSRASARGLMQIMPTTGRSLSRRLGIKPYGVASLFRPELNLRMGTFYFRDMLDRLGGNVEAALAAYNAGKSRVDQWLSWGDFREPAEFIETIPFSETRGYVQSVLRNAEMYRRIYGARPVAAREASATASAAERGAAPKKKSAAKRK